MSIASAIGLTGTLGTIASTAIPAAAGMAAGGVKDALAAGHESKMRKLSADQMKWSPWTGIAHETVQGAQPGAGILGGLGAGLATAQNYQRSAEDDKFRNKWLEIMEKSQLAGAK